MKTILAITALAVCQFSLAQKTVGLKPFSNIAASGNIDITLEHSSENKMVIKTGVDDNFKYSSDGEYLALSNDKGKEIEVVVYYNGTLESIAVSGGVEVESKGSIKTKKLMITAGGGSEININTEADQVNTTAGSGSEINISGTAKSIQATAASGAEIQAEKLQAGNSSVTVASGAEVAIHATGVVYATVASGAELNIFGNPKTVNEVTASGGEINIIK